MPRPEPFHSIVAEFKNLGFAIRRLSRPHGRAAVPGERAARLPRHLVAREGAIVRVRRPRPPFQLFRSVDSSAPITALDGQAATGSARRSTGVLPSAAASRQMLSMLTFRSARSTLPT